MQHVEPEEVVGRTNVSSSSSSALPSGDCDAVWVEPIWGAT